MKWNQNKSIMLSRIAVYVCMGLLLAVWGMAPWLITLLLRLRAPELFPLRPLFLLSVYALSVPAAAALCGLYRLLGNIAAARVFLAENVGILRRLSWYCFAAALLCLASAFYWLPFLVVGGAAAFMGLILRVVKNVFAVRVFLFV